MKQDDYYGIPFEWDRSWRLKGRFPMDLESMSQACRLLIGTFDFSSFRGAKCERPSPVVTVKDIQVRTQPYGHPDDWSTTNSDFDALLGLAAGPSTAPDATPQLITIQITGKSFLYRQVRNIVGALVDVGFGKLQVGDIHELLAHRDRAKAPRCAPAHGLFLVGVQHGDFQF
jgi:tRNA pseudouridine38-40 synthase